MVTKEKKARGLMVLSMSIFGTIGLFVRYIPLPSGEIALYRAVMASILLAGYLLFTKQKIHVKQIGKDLVLLLLSGIAMGINWILLFEAYKYTTVSVATLSYYFAPVLVTVACPILFKERLNKRQILCFIMSTLGLVLITGLGELGGNRTHMIGILFGLGAACLYATVILLNKFIKGVEGLVRTFLQFLAAVLVLIPYVACTGGSHLDQLVGLGWGALIAVGVIHTGLTYCMYFTSIKDMSGQQVAILSYIDPLVAVLISVCLLGETMTISQVVGGILILGFTLLNEYQSSK